MNDNSVLNTSSTGIDSHAINKGKPLIFACIPALNEEYTIGGIILEVKKHVSEVYVCDDGSSDLTGDLAEALGAHVIRHKSNLGKGAAIRDLFKVVKEYNPDIVVVLDADRQHNPEDIPILCEPLLTGEADIVIGSRFTNNSGNDAPLYRRIGLKIFNFNGKLGVSDVQSGFRAFSGKALKILSQTQADGYGVETEQIIIANKNMLRIKEMPVFIKYKNILKASKMNPLAHGIQIFSTMIRLISDERPLLLLGVPAIFSFIIGIISTYYLLFYFNINKYFSIPLAFTSIFFIILSVVVGIAALILFSMSRLRHQVEN